MNKFIRKNQKKLLAIFGAFLMVVFILPSTMKNGGNGGGNSGRDVGTIDGVKVSARELALSKDEWQMLRLFYYRDPNNNEDYNPPRLVDRLLGPPSQDRNTLRPWQIIDRNPTAFYLLVQEGRKAGIVPNPEDVVSILTNNIQPPITDEDALSRAEPAMADLLAVSVLLERQGDVVKISKPMLDLVMARTSQELTLDVAGFPAADYLSKVKPPTPAQIRNQYDTYSDRLPDGYGAAGDLLGFGYKYPNRSKVEYMGVKRNDVRAAAIASKSPLDWNLAAVTEFKANRAQYDDQEVQVPSTQPSLKATTRVAGTTLPTTLPAMVSAVKKLDDVNADFALHVDLVLKSLYDTETSTMTDTIAKKISETMAADFGAWREAQAGHGPTTRPITALGVPYDSWDYVVALAASIQKQYGVLPTYGKVDRFETAKQLADIDGIGKAYMTFNRAQIPFAGYATELITKTMADDVKTGTAAAAALAINQPSNLMLNGDDIYIFRVTDADATHTAPIGEVQDQVVADYKLSQAYQLAADAARAVLSDAGIKGLDVALLTSGRPGVTRTDPFVAEEVKGAGAEAKIEPLKIKAPSALQLADAAEQLLTAGGDTLHPMSLVELYADATPMVIQLVKAKVSYPADIADLYRARTAYMMENQQSAELISNLVSYDAVALRVGYKPTPTDNLKQ